MLANKGWGNRQPKKSMAIYNRATDQTKNRLRLSLFFHRLVNGYVLEVPVVAQVDQVLDVWPADPSASAGVKWGNPNVLQEDAFSLSQVVKAFLV